MKKLLIVLTLMSGFATGLCAQTARTVLDKCAAVVSAKGGVSANFTMESAQYGSASGTIAVKGEKFHASTPVASMWFDGKTQWTYLQRNNEVSVTTPSEGQLQAINPYNFINMYKNGFKYSMTTTADTYNVHLTATDGKKKVQEMFICVDKSSYAPKEVKMRQGTKWTTFVITNLKTATLDDSTFSFSSKDFPSAEVIDLR